MSVLLRQAHGFEGLSPREERANGDDLTVSQPSVNGELLVPNGDQSLHWLGRGTPCYVRGFGHLETTNGVPVAVDES